MTPQKTDESGDLPEGRSPQPAPAAREECWFDRPLPWSDKPRWVLLKWLLKAARCSALIALVAVAFAAYAGTQLLHICADLWCVEDRVSSADAVYILGGEWANRSRDAVAMYRAGKVSRILLADTELLIPDEQAELKPQASWLARHLTQRGVPREAIELVGQTATSTHDEARALSDWLVKNPSCRSVVITTELFHTRRVKWVMEHEKRSPAVAIHVMPVTRGAYSTADWWRDEQAVVAFHNEVLKSLVYWMRY